MRKAGVIGNVNRLRVQLKFPQLFGRLSKMVCEAASRNGVTMGRSLFPSSFFLISSPAAVSGSKKTTHFSCSHCSYFCCLSASHRGGTSARMIRCAQLGAKCFPGSLCAVTGQRHNPHELQTLPALRPSEPRWSYCA